jgi:hypothetical protein
MKKPDRIERIDDGTHAQYRSASTNAALGILAATPFLEAGAEVAKDWVQDKLSNEPPPKIELPPGVERD